MLPLYMLGKSFSQLFVKKTIGSLLAKICVHGREWSRETKLIEYESFKEHGQSKVLRQSTKHEARTVIINNPRPPA